MFKTPIKAKPDKDQDQVDFVFQGEDVSASSYGPGEMLKGTLQFNNTEKLQIYSIELTFIGSEKSALSMKTVTEVKKTNNIRNKKNNHTSDIKAAKKVYFKRSTFLLNAIESGGTILMPGLYSFNFTLNFKLANFPATARSTDYDISYNLLASINKSRRPSSESIIKNMPINFQPKVCIDMFKITDSETFYFCDNVHDSKDGKLMYHVEAISIQKRFEPGSHIELQLKMCGKRTLFQATAVLMEQTDGFYPASPNSVEGLCDMTGRTWTKQNAITSPVEVVFETKTTTPTICYKHCEDSENRFSKEFFAVLKIPVVPLSVACLPETFYLRFTYYVLLNGFSNSSWGGTRSFNIRIPVSFSNISKISDKVPSSFLSKSQKGSSQQRKQQAATAKFTGFDISMSHSPKEMRKGMQDPSGRNKGAKGAGGMHDRGMQIPKSPRSPMEGNFGVSAKMGPQVVGNTEEDEAGVYNETFSKDFCETFQSINKYNCSSNNKQLYRSKANSMRKNVVPLGFAKHLEQNEESDTTLLQQNNGAPKYGGETPVADILVTNPALLPELEHTGSLFQDLKTGSTKVFNI
ncbi:hypothetical protein BB561_003012 [Smittium simulii]|uniref:Arrestin-like N-terminal domain-containing protein n=1 Tax=Smittium simulii TaxID=133385 RepID=A0A2T9YNH8_9FUNG|nr:hypothetical protein BB561_003012 [Smittium simulii]